MLTLDQLLEWEAYDRLDPIGEVRGDYRMAYLSMIITNIARRVHGKEGTTMAGILDFMPEWDKDHSIKPEAQTVEEMKTVLQNIVTRQGLRKKGFDKTKKK